MLITSQDPLHLQEEWLMDLAGLVMPDEDIESESAAAAYSAVQLFLKIGQRLNPPYRPSPLELQAISQICRQLQDMPWESNWPRSGFANSRRRRLPRRLGAGWISWLPICATCRRAIAACAQPSTIHGSC
jgi:hypothetical protein